ncbi:MAG: hypothetical protein QW407_05830 [Thermofilaceae archaeon]
MDAVAVRAAVERSVCKRVVVRLLEYDGPEPVELPGAASLSDGRVGYALLEMLASPGSRTSCSAGTSPGMGWGCGTSGTSQSRLTGSRAVGCSAFPATLHAVCLDVEGEAGCFIVWAKELVVGGVTVMLKW